MVMLIEAVSLALYHTDSVGRRPLPLRKLRVLDLLSSKRHLLPDVTAHNMLRVGV